MAIDKFVDWDKAKEVHNCEWCGREFTPKRRDQKYCSNFGICRFYAYNYSDGWAYRGYRDASPYDSKNSYIHKLIGYGYNWAMLTYEETGVYLIQDSSKLKCRIKLYLDFLLNNKSY